MEQLKTARRQKKAAVTRHLGTLQRLVAEEDVDGVQTRLQQLRVSFQELETSHNSYTDKLEDDNEIEESDKWFADIQTTYTFGIKSAKTWLKSADNEQITEQSAGGDSDIKPDLGLTNLVDLLSIPKVEIDTFDGNPMEYQTFMAIFDEVVDNKEIDTQVKLTRLLQYTAGSAKSSIKNCALIGGDAGYNQARDILKNRFGDSHLVSQKVIADLRGGKKVTRAHELQQLADGLNMAVAALQQLGSETSYQLNTLNNRSCQSSKVVSLSLAPSDGSEAVKMNNVLVVSSIPARYPGHVMDMRQYPYLADLPMKRVDQNVQTDILIGMDNAHVLMPLEVRSDPHNRNKPYAVRTMFGWSLNGPVSGQPSNVVMSNFVDLSQQVEKLWDIETRDDDVTSMSYEDKRVLDLWNTEVRHEDGHYVLPIPWKDGAPKLPDNRYAAKVRLTGLQKKLHKTGMAEVYQENLTKTVTDWYAERVPESELSMKDGSVWYLPHHAVVSEAKPGKVRVVFDCAAKQDGISLNNQCYQGPDLNNKLMHVLLRFRQYKYAITADVEAMYHQVKVPLKDRNALRFLWGEGNSLVEYRMTSHLFGGVWCASSSTFALRKTVEDSPASDLVRNIIRDAFYVDDMLTSVKTVEDATEIIKGVKPVLKFGGFNLTKFIVNDTQLLQNIDSKDRAKEVKEISSEMHGKALGIRWDVIGDAFYYVSRHSEPQSDITKRRMLSQLSAMYDPLGLVSPVMLRGKIMFQEATRLKLSWDELIQGDLAQRWSTWLTSLSDIPHLRFPRCVIPEKFADGAVELHHFCDASEKGYGACTYVRAISPQGAVHVALLASKGRIAPIKRITIPRLELTAAVVAVKLDCMIRRELDVSLLRSTFWTDSQIALAYIRNESKRFKVFVANRVSLIRDQSSPDQWHHVGSGENPADILSRGCNVKDLPPIWTSGPQFLADYKSSWALAQEPDVCILNEDPEVKREELARENGGPAYVNATTARENTGCLHPLETLINHYSDYYRLKKAVCWILRFKSHLKGEKVNLSDPVTVTEMDRALSILIEYVQKESFRQEIKTLEEGQVLPKRHPIYKLTPQTPL